MATTSPDNILTPDAGDQYALVQDLGLMADSIQAALNSKQSNVFKGTASQRAAFLSTATVGMLWQDTDGIGMIWKKVGVSWVPAVWRWAGTTAQMNGFTQAPNGFEWANTTDGVNYARTGGAWKSLAEQFVQVGGVPKAIAASYATLSWLTGTPQVSSGLSMVSSGQPTRITVPAKGVYAVSYNIRQNGTTSSSSRLVLNGSTIPDSVGQIDSGANGALGAAVTLGASGFLSLNSGDYVSVEVISSAAIGGVNWLAASTFSAQLVKSL